ncbi:uncharacterized protein LOC134718072 [Mytilus trossulus]|uniref:uncharacterized protein LOC134718072 n=1 Tax=Mytilus trossulus TaxID=6551 RepID=UPI0030043995
MSSAIQSALAELNLQIFQKFNDERIDDDTFQHLTNQDFSRLGVETIGDRISTTITNNLSTGATNSLEALVSSTDEQTDEVIDHLKIKVIISSEDNLPNGYERITYCSDVAVPRKWLIQILGVCKGKSSSYCVKKFIDGFFEPEEFIHLSASKAVATMPVMKAIRLYAINKLRMRDAEFTSAFNSKIGTFKDQLKWREE